MTAIRKEAIELLERIPDDKLSFVIQIMRGVDGLLGNNSTTAEKAPVDWDSFVVSSERGENVEEYMREMRDNDRL